MTTRPRRILESKAAYRRQLARKPIAEKLRMVEELAERTLAIRRRKQKAKGKVGSPAPPNS